MDCEVIYDFIGLGGIIIPKGTTARILKFESTFFWIDVYVEEVGEPIPFPISYWYIKFKP